MNRANPTGLLACAIGMIAVLGGLSLWKGGLYMNRYEGDVLHLVEIVMRMVDGQRPHLDFMTPIGVLATWPIAVFVKAGLSLGMAIHAAQILLALVLLGPVFRAAHSRFTGGLAYLFVVLMMVLPLALVHGGTDANISLSMHYNRWAWALSLVALTLAVLPPLGARHQMLDGVIIGVLLGAVVLIKVTYVVALAPAVIAGLLIRGETRTLIAGLIAGVVTLAGATVLFGIAFWPAYVQDLLTTVHSELRPFPGRPFGEVLTAPMLLGAHLLALMAIILLRQGRQTGPGLLLLILLPGLVYITYQNFGNDPQWVLWLGLVLFMSRPEAGLKNAWGWELRPALGLTAIALMAVGSASFFNLAYSPFRHASVATETYVGLFPRSAQEGGLFFPRARASKVDLLFDGDARYPQFSYTPSDPEDAEKPTVLAGEVIEECKVQNGVIKWFEQMAHAVDKAGYADGSQIMMADLLSNLALFNDGIDWLKGGAPWGYDGLPGIASADYVLVPICALVPKTRQRIVADLTREQIPLHEVFRNDMFILLKNGAKDQRIASTR